ncbi:unnamed protein product, partial [Caretta caretta]
MSFVAKCVSPEVENGGTNGVQPVYRARDIIVFECNPGYTLEQQPRDSPWENKP